MIRISGIAASVILPASIVILLSGCSQDQEAITGLYYADSKPVAITLQDGKISNVKKIKILPEEIRVFYKAKGPEKTIITSDVTSYAALPPGKFVNIEGDTLELTPEGIVKYPAQNVLAGSASPLKKGIANVMKVTNCTLEDAVNMVTRNPANLYGFDDRGAIEPGKRADLVLFRINNNEIEIVKTIVDGKVVYSR